MPAQAKKRRQAASIAGKCLFLQDTYTIKIFAMQYIKDKEFGGERPLSGSRALHLDSVRILAGESAIKECTHIVATNCHFDGNYPFWHVLSTTIQN